MLAQDTAVYGIAAAINKSFALILFPLLTRLLTVEDYGRLDFALYAAALFGLLVVWGQDSAVARLFFEDEKTEDRQQVISQALLIMLANLGIGLAIFLGLTRSPTVSETFGPHTAPILVLLAFYAPLSGLLSFSQSVLKWTFRRNEYVALALGAPAANLALILLASRQDSFDPVTALGIMTTVSGLLTGISLFLIRRWLVMPRHTDFVRRLLPLALPYGAIACIGALSPLFERAVVAGVFGAADLGLYAAAAKIASIAMMLSIAFQMGWGPFSYSIYKRPDAARTYSLVLRGFAALMCLTVLALAALAGPLAGFLAGEQYRPASIFVFPLAMAFGLQAIGWITEIGIHLSKRTYLNLVGFGLFLVISLGGIVILSRAIGMIGVPVAAMAGQLAMLLASAVIAQKVFRLAWDYRVPTITVMVTLATGGIATAYQYSDPSAAVWKTYAAGIGLVLVVNLLFGISRDDWRRIQALVRSGSIA